ncbi:biotin/lipoyl-binding protein [Eubacteriales bacterium OttesenSCG-928-K08]|nr:biotin/lipoyl-binding protein [Eubacteriales bacterium OttesenSCG-928-K08]
MRKFNVNVNGTSYEVVVEEIAAGAAPVAAAPVAAPAPVVAAPVVAAPVAAAPAGGESVSAPMPGTILAVNVKVGDAVKAGDVGMVLEAMKMENEMMVPATGTVTSVRVGVGAAVETGDVLFTVG